FPPVYAMYWERTTGLLYWPVELLIERGGRTSSEHGGRAGDTIVLHPDVTDNNRILNTKRESADKDRPGKSRPGAPHWSGDPAQRTIPRFCSASETGTSGLSCCRRS